MKLAHEDVRVAPRDRFSRELLKDSLEDILLASSSATQDAESEKIADEDVDLMEGVSGTIDDEPIDDEVLPPIGSFFSSMLSSYFDGDPKKDIGDYSSNKGPEDGEKLNSTEQETLDMMYSVLGSEQVNRKKMEFPRPGLSRRQYRLRLMKIWKEPSRRLMKASWISTLTS